MNCWGYTKIATVISAKAAANRCLLPDADTSQYFQGSTGYDFFAGQRVSQREGARCPERLLRPPRKCPGRFAEHAAGELSHFRWLAPKEPSRCDGCWHLYAGASPECPHCDSKAVFFAAAPGTDTQEQREQTHVRHAYELLAASVEGVGDAGRLVAGGRTGGREENPAKCHQNVFRTMVTAAQKFRAESSKPVEEFRNGPRMRHLEGSRLSVSGRTSTQDTLIDLSGLTPVSWTMRLLSGL